MDRDCPCSILVKKVTVFFRCPKDLPVTILNRSGLMAVLERFGLLALAEEISRWPRSDCVAWLLVAMLIRSILERNKLSKEKYKLYNLRRKRTPGSVVDLSPVLKEIKYLKTSLMLSRIKGTGTSEQDLTQLRFQLAGRN